MNQHTTKFFNSDEVYISSRMNEYLKKNFGYEITGDLEALREAKASLEVTKAELKDEYMSAKYVENMLMIETIKSLLKAHGNTLKEETTTEASVLAHGGKGQYKAVSSGGVVRIMHKGKEIASGDFDSGADGWFVSREGDKGQKFFGNAQDMVDHFADKKITEEDDDEEEKGTEHYRWKNDSQLSIAKDKLEACMSQLDHAIEYRAENSHKFFNTGDKAGTGDLYRMKEQLEKLHDGWEEATELYGM